MVNFRDIASASGGKIRQGVLFRSAGPLYCAEPSLDHVRTWIDLRTADECRESALNWNFKRIFVPLQISDDLFRAVVNPGSEDWIALYRRATERLLPELIQIAKFIITEEKPILISCSAGKDRTGTAIAFLLYLAGVEQTTIVQDYCKTSDVAKELSEKHLSRLRNKGLSDSQLVQAYFVARADVIVGLLLYFEEQRSRIFTILAQSAFKDSDLESLRRCLVE